MTESDSEVDGYVSSDSQSDFDEADTRASRAVPVWLQLQAVAALGLSLALALAVPPAVRVKFTSQNRTRTMNRPDRPVLPLMR